VLTAIIATAESTIGVLSDTKEGVVKATDRLVDFIIETKYEDVPPEAFDVLKRACLDNVGTILAGAAQPVGRMIIEYTRESGGTPESTVLGAGFRTSATMAALANGTMGHALDYDDMGAYGHPTTSLFPALLAIGEKIQASGRDVLTAYVVGFEVAAALNRGGGYVQYESGFHSTPLFGTIASTAGSARLLDLDREQTRMALGIAASEASGLQRNNGTMTKPLHAGMACRNGVMAAILAKKGFTAYEDIFEARTGFCDTFIGEGRYSMDAIADKLGNPFTVHNTIVTKPYPCCGGNNTALDAIFALIEENDIGYDNVERVDVGALSYTSPVMRFPEPKRGLEGKFSIRHNLACAILDKQVVIDTHTDEKIRDPRVREAWQKVHTHVVARWDLLFASGGTASNPVTITLKDGRVLSRKVDRHEIKGSPANPMSKKELVAKFRNNALLSVSEKAVDQAVERWLDLESVGDITQAVAPLAG
jgi:2-methylcitrate dehydratase PrpD